MMDFGNYLRKKRREKQYSIKHLADLIHISPGYISNMECGKRGAPSFETLEKISAALDLSVSDRYCLFDLAAETKNKPAVSRDLSDYINKTSGLKTILRYSMKRCMTGKDWEKIFVYIKEYY